MTADNRVDEELVGDAAPPTANGELVFDAPWQSRVFGMARVLCERGYFEWDEFRVELIHQISEWEASHSDAEPYQYYDLFFAALARLIDQKSLCRNSDLTLKVQEFAARSHDHDH